MKDLAERVEQRSCWEASRPLVVLRPSWPGQTWRCTISTITSPSQSVRKVFVSAAEVKIVPSKSCIFDLLCHLDIYRQTTPSVVPMTGWTFHLSRNVSRHDLGLPVQILIRRPASLSVLLLCHCHPQESHQPTNISILFLLKQRFSNLSVRREDIISVSEYQIFSPPLFYILNIL